MTDYVRMHAGWRAKSGALRTRLVLASRAAKGEGPKAPADFVVPNVAPKQLADNYDRQL